VYYSASSNEKQESRMTTPLTTKVALVTGAAQGIGAETARLLAERGASVVVADIDKVGTERVAAEICAKGGIAHAIAFDLTSEEAIAAAVGEIDAKFSRIDILHNNAALQTEAQRTMDSDVINLDARAWDAAMAVNARGPMLMCKHVIPIMLRHGGGSIINSTSGFGLLGESTLTSYGASKAALINLSRFVATQYGKQGIRSNTVAIGFVLTETAIATTPPVVKDILLSHHLTAALGTPRDVAEVVAFLASDAAIFVNGALIPVDGGFTAHQASYADFQKLFAAMGSSKL
jgi:NAD(P)-dependent dehydrogenase (short-subunit alcohol dehydrogenase family)